MKHWQAVAVAVVTFAAVLLLIRWVTAPDAWEQACLQRGGHLQQMLIDYDGQTTQRFQICQDDSGTAIEAREQ